VTHLIPARYFVAILQTLFLAGDIWPIVLWNSAALAVMMLFFLGLARRKMHKRLDA
jgi:ABC-2 type transport system permease protein